MTGQHLHIIARSLVPASTSYMFPSCTWVLSGVSCSSMPASCCCLCLFLAHWDGPVFSVKEVISEKHLMVSSPGSSPTEFYQAETWKSQSLLFSSLGCDPTFYLVPFSQHSELHYLMVTAAKTAPDLHIPDQFLYVCKYEVQRLPAVLMHPSWNTDFCKWEKSKTPDSSLDFWKSLIGYLWSDLLNI